MISCGVGGGFLTAALSSFFLPELCGLHPSDIPIRVALNKVDLAAVLTKRDVMKVVKPFFPTAQYFPTTKMNRNSCKNELKSVFDGMHGDVWGVGVMCEV